ncbi:Tautomerase/MIF superfamily [Phycomyces blakesleeanus]|uniref:L-dopachrome isomerase n=1 Tax=Phycomyces blakesleeanus TaxID=4837 RepID=A0ABR3BBB1_PHYBL
MPILEITSNRAPRDVESFVKTLSARFAEAIGKPESYCLVTFTRVDSLYFAGNGAAGFLAKVGSIGHIDNERNASLTALITDVLKKELGTGHDRGYFLFSDFTAANIGFKDTTFAELSK